MAVRIRSSKKKVCNSCESNGGKFWDIGIGPQDVVPHVTTLCDTCMHTLLQKLIIVGKEANEV